MEGSLAYYVYFKCSLPQMTTRTRGQDAAGTSGGRDVTPTHLLGFVRTKGEVDGFALITNLALGVLQSQVDGDDVGDNTAYISNYDTISLQ